MSAIKHWKINSNLSNFKTTYIQFTNLTEPGIFRFSDIEALLIGMPSKMVRS
jgi:hypothetical protein